MARRPLNFNRKRGSGRSFTVFIILFALALTIAPPVKHYFTQRAQINSLRSQLDSNNQALIEARKELLLWQDPEYIKSQASERLHFVLPGERQYIVTESGNQGNSTEGTQVANNIPNGQPWYMRLVASITEAGNP